MLPADLDDEERINIAHEHPTDLDSGPSSASSPGSGVPTFLQQHHRSKSAARHRSHTTTEGSSSHLLARLIAQDEEVRELNATLFATSQRVEAESSRADAAERRALDYFSRLRSTSESRERADQDSARLREELKLYKLQLENAQKEIFRAQDIINQVSAQRNEAEAEAARARTKARKLQEEKLVMLAREEGHRLGYREGLSIGRRVGFNEGRQRLAVEPSNRLRQYPHSQEDDTDDNEEDDTAEEEERNDPRPQAQMRSRASNRHHPSITARARSRHPLYVLTILHPTRRYFPCQHSSLPFPSARPPMSPARPLHKIQANQRPFARSQSALVQSYLTILFTSLPMVGSQGPIPAHHIYLYLPHTNSSSPSPPRPALSLLTCMTADPVTHNNPARSHPFVRGTMLITHLYLYLRRFSARRRLFHAPRHMSPSTILYQRRTNDLGVPCGMRYTSDEPGAAASPPEVPSLKTNIEIRSDDSRIGPRQRA
ncbi:hypothetical protein PAXRUDRAFT_651114 [Paxillus rubicundulus Ve08.2h10]|uniref:Uncharacterized protein n=1 Tax=Paxillus rubicundulus Ve08.2h10 TaxID=930991 RepID=A0A0D0DXH6_9AGAM|nr:hypothetical protein PAXRUDRAFT_651114 [Paxillus rubicundulus Ve08.2h10]